MNVACWLLLAIGVLGALDIALFHVLAHDLRRHRESRAELVTHALRGPTYALLFAAVPNLALHGAWFWALVGLLAVDLAISIADFALERRSRALLGGLPTGEYLLHVSIAILYGAFVAAVAFEAGAWADLPTRVAWEPAPVPDVLRWTLTAMAPLVLATGALDALAVVRLGRARGTVRATTSPAPGSTAVVAGERSGRQG
jgi:hypothetical protein